jgi:hypothetical protein
MNTNVQQTYVSPAKLNMKKFDEDIQLPQQTLTTTEQLAEQTAQMLDDLRK